MAGRYVLIPIDAEARKLVINRILPVEQIPNGGRDLET
jgi:hypothetical protein